MVTPDNLLYTKTHEWVLFVGGKARVGLTDYAQDALGDIVYLSMPEIGAEVNPADEIGEVESVKAVSEVCAAVGGRVCDVNGVLADAPELINTAPYDSWIFEIEGDGGREDLLSPEQYEALCREEEH